MLWVVLFHLAIVKINGADTAVSNMEVIEGLVIVVAEVNGQSGSFILDTGSPDLILNSRYFSGTKSEISVSDILGGLQELSEVHVRRFDWMNISKRFINALALDLQSLEHKTSQPILGLIGYELLRGHEILIDYQQQRIELIPVAAKKALASRLLAQLPFQMQGHLPVIEVKMGDYVIRLGLDSGAQANVLDSELLGLLPENLFLGEKKFRVKGIGGKSREVPVRELTGFRLGRAQILGQYFAFLPMSFLTSPDGIPVDGMLGFPFLSKAKVSINYIEKTLCFYD